MTAVLFQVRVTGLVQVDLEETLGSASGDVFQHRVHFFRRNVLHYVGTDRVGHFEMLKLVEKRGLDELDEVPVLRHVLPKHRNVIYEDPRRRLQQVTIQETRTAPEISIEVVLRNSGAYMRQATLVRALGPISSPLVGFLVLGPFELDELFGLFVTHRSVVPGLLEPSVRCSE